MMKLGNYKCVHQLFEEQAFLTPDAIAVVFGTEKITYGELNRKVNQLAHHLISLGAQPDMIIGICMDRSIDLIIGFLGILKAGSAYLPIDLSYPQDRLSYMIKDAGITFLLTQKQLAEKIPQSKAANIYLDEFDFENEKSSNPDVKITTNNLAYVIYTSGSTGTPKGVMVEHKGIVNYILWAKSFYLNGKTSGFPLFTSVSFDLTITSIFTPLISGGLVGVYNEDLSGTLLQKIINDKRITVIKLTPSHLKLIQHLDSSKSSVKKLIVGGEQLQTKLSFDVHKSFAGKIKIYNEYGPTETSVGCMIYEFNPGETEQPAVPVGKAIDGMRIYLLDSSLQPIKENETGEIFIAGIGVARGYLNNNELTNKKFLTDPFFPNEKMYKSGDLAKFLPDGNIEFLGRVDDQVKIRGYRIEPGEIENKLKEFAGVKDCVVITHNYSEQITRLIAYIVSNKKIQTEDLKNFSASFLPDYMVPDSFIFVESIPITINGKVDKKALPIPSQTHLADNRNNSFTDADEIEKKLFPIWKELLGIENFGLKDNFFDLGGNSLLMSQLQIKLNAVLNEQLNITDLYQSPTIAGLAQIITNTKKHPANKYNVKSSKRFSNNDVAIIGMAGRYPGAKTIKEFWKNLSEGVESISFFTEEELEYLPKGNLKSELIFVKARGVIEDVDMFDAEFFGYTPREAETMDPQHRIFLECAWEALDDAGYTADKFEGSIGVYAGSSINAYLMYNVLKDREAQDELLNAYQIGEYKTFTGNDNAFLTTKVAYKLGLTGPAINIQTACSTSLVAIGQAYQSLISGETDMVLAGGISISFPQKRGYFFVDGSIGSIDGHCKTFDADATGTVFSSGAGLIVMKRLEDAINDGDSIYSVIKAVALNNDGAGKAGYMAPSVDGQVEVILKAHQAAGIEAESIKYIEAHGTGTPVGDPVEVAALEKAFRISTDKKQFCGIGSVKSNVGHTDAAAGVTGIIKTALSLKHRMLPPSLHYTNPNPRIDFNNSPFYVVDKLTRLNEIDSPVRAGVSAFGVGGTNAHAILEEYPEPIYLNDAEKEKHVLIVSAKTETALMNNMNALKDYLKINPDEVINDVAFTLHHGRKEFDWRQFIVTENCTEACDEITKTVSSQQNKAKINSNEKPHLVFMFPGQGAQYVNMGKGLYENEKIFSASIDKCAEILKPHLELDIRDLLFPTDNNEDSAKKLEQTVYTQPALFIVEYALAQFLISRGIKPASMIGHSVGEYVAACLAGVFSLEDALFILSMRAKLMQQQAPGSMLSVRLNETEIQEYLSDDISLAAINSPTLLVLSGETEKIKSLSEKLSLKNIENRFLFTSHAYHSKMMEPALNPFISEFTKIKLNKPSAPFISSLTGTWITDEQATDPNYWAAQLRNAVRFSYGVIELQKKNNLVLIELGPGRALSTMASQHRNENVNQTTITTLIQPNENNYDSKNILTAIGKLWTAGLKIDWNNFHTGKKRRRLHLPAYQFDRKSYWIEAPKNGRSKSLIQEPAQIQNRVKQLVKKPKTKKVVQENTMTRKEYISDLLKDILEELSGIKKESLLESKTFLELGFDSLFMTQVSLAFQRKLEVKITLRQLIDTFPTIPAIAEYIDSKLPAGKFEPPKQEVIVEEEGEEFVEEYVETSYAENSQPAAQSNSGNSVVERLVHEQLELMKRQLELLGGNGIKNVPSNKSETKIQKEEPAAVTPAETLAPTKEAKKVFERFGPYKPIETKKGEGLSTQQQKYLDKLISDYTIKTAGSKKLTQEHRAHYSDPRTVSGFLPIWKEMTYQVITKKSEGSKLWDVDENEYIDVIMGFGQYLFGHNPKFVRDAIEEQLKMGFEIGPQSPIAGEVAKLICEFTGMDRAAFCVTGSEAVLGAIRAARTVTGKDKIVFFTGDYHGIIDEVLVKTTVNGDQIRTMPIAPGIPKENVQNSITLDYGTEESLAIIEKLLPEIAAVMVEPVQARRPDFQPKEFLQKLRKMTEAADVALIFDEVITGFRSTQGGAQEFFDVKADIGTFGKVIGGGFPIGVIAGKKLYMDAFDGGTWQYGDDSIPEAGVTFFAGTFARHPLSLTACYAVLNYLKSKNGSVQKDLNEKAGLLSEELNKFLALRNVPIKIMNFSSVIYYSYPKDLSYFSLLFYLLRHKGIHILEGFPMFLSEAHTEQDIKKILSAFKESIIELQENGFFPAPLNEDEQTKACMCHTDINKNKYQLAEAQKEIWVASLMSDKASCAFNESSHLILKGKLNVWALEKAFNKVIERHEALRTTFSDDGRHQIVNSKSEFKLSSLDLSSLHEKEKQKILEERLNTETTKLFDLSKGPLLRAELVKLNDELHYVIITAHHIICDGWSFDVMVRDLSRIYTEEIEQKFSTPEPAMQMREFIEYMEKTRNTDEYKNQENYWLNQFKPALSEIDLPVDYPRPEIRTFNGARILGRIEKDLFAKVKTLSYKTGNTLFVTLLSVFSVLLNKLTQEEDIITGIPAAGQQVVGVDDLIGHCTNLLPIRSSVQPNLKFSEYLKQVKLLVLDAYDNQQVTYGDLISKLKIKRSAGRTPMLSTMFNVDPAIMGLKFSGLESKLITTPRSGYQFELGFNLVNSDEVCDIECDYCTDLFSTPTIQKFIEYYNHILEQVIEDSDKPLKEIQILSSSEIEDLMNFMNNGGDK